MTIRANVTVVMVTVLTTNPCPRSVRVVWCGRAAMLVATAHSLIECFPGGNSLVGCIRKKVTTNVNITIPVTSAAVKKAKKLTKGRKVVAGGNTSVRAFDFIRQAMTLTTSVVITSFISPLILLIIIITKVLITQPVFRPGFIEFKSAIV